MSNLFLEIALIIVVIGITFAVAVVILNQYSPFKICAEKNWIGNITLGKKTFDCAILKEVNVSLGGIGG